MARLRQRAGYVPRKPKDAPVTSHNSNLLGGALCPIVVELSGTWQLRMTEYDTGNPESLSAGEQSWLETEVPGDAHQALM